MTDQEMKAIHERREVLVRRACLVMCWDYHTSPAFTGIRKVAMADAVAVGLDKLAAMLDEIEQLRVVLRGVHEMAEEDLRHGGMVDGTSMYQIEADTRAALKAEVPS